VLLGYLQEELTANPASKMDKWGTSHSV